MVLVRFGICAAKRAELLHDPELLAPSRFFLYHSRDDPEVPFAHLGYYQEYLPTATARPIDGSEPSFVEGLTTLVDDIRACLNEDQVASDQWCNTLKIAGPSAPARRTVLTNRTRT